MVNETYSTILQQYESSNKFGDQLGMNLKDHGNGYAHYTLEITPNHLATPIAAHGGVLAAFMDGLLGVTALTAVAGENKVVATVEFKINFLEPVHVGDILSGKGKVVRKGSRLVLTEAQVFSGEKIIATGSGTFNAYPAYKAGINTTMN